MDKKIGAQLYTVRDYCRTIEDFDKTCEKVSKIGYKLVQLSSIGDFGAEEIKEVLDKYGLKTVVTHRPAANYIEKIDEEIKFHKTLGMKYAGIGAVNTKDAWFNGVTKKDIDAFTEEFRPVMDKLYENGITFCYHNHHLEFTKYDGEYIIDYLARKTDPEKLKFILDVYWLSYSGVNPAEFIRKNKGRIACVHFKDIKVRNGKPDIDLCEVGQGNINWDEVIKACEESDVDYALVEQDTCDRDPFECLETSYKFLKEKGFC